MGGSSSAKQEHKTSVQNITTTDIRDIGLTGAQFRDVAASNNLAIAKGFDTAARFAGASSDAFNTAAFQSQQNTDAATALGESFQVGAHDLSGALATGFTALSQTAQAQSAASVERAKAQSQAQAISAQAFAPNLGDLAIPGEPDTQRMILTGVFVIGGIASLLTIWSILK